MLKDLLKTRGGCAMKIERKLTIDVELTPEDLADCFCDLYADGQAIFFNRISELVGKWDTGFCFQVQLVGSSGKLTSGGRGIMRTIGEYSEVIK